MSPTGTNDSSPAGTLDSSSEGPLAGIGVLVTRPEHQAQDLVDAISSAGGQPLRFPAFEVVARPETELQAAIGRLSPADVVIFVSANAARLGAGVLKRVNDGFATAAIGPATAAALDALGIDVCLRPDGGFDSENLLADAALESVAGKTVTIVRGDPGRELLARTLTERGATVQYLSAYSLKPRAVPAGELERLEAALASGEIDATVIMSVRTFDCLEQILPARSMEALARGILVAPGARVIQTLEQRLPGACCVESPGADARTVVQTIEQTLESSRQGSPDSR